MKVVGDGIADIVHAGLVGQDVARDLDTARDIIAADVGGGHTRFRVKGAALFQLNVLCARDRRHFTEIRIPLGIVGGVPLRVRGYLHRGGLTQRVGVFIRVDHVDRSIDVAVLQDPVYVRDHHTHTALRGRLAELVELSGVQIVMHRGDIGHAVEQVRTREARDEHAVDVAVQRVPRLLEVDREIACDGDIAAARTAGADHRPDGHGELAVLVLGVGGDSVGAAVDGQAVDIPVTCRNVFCEDILVRLDRGRHLVGTVRLGVLRDMEGTLRREYLLKYAGGPPQSKEPDARGHLSVLHDCS